jgi:PAS domain S-box-containing protein
MHGTTQAPRQPYEDTVRARLLRLAVLLLLPGLSLAATVTWQSLQADRAAVQVRLSASAARLAAAVDAALGETAAQLRLLAASDSLAQGDMAAFTPLARAAGRLGARIVLRDSAGAVLLDTGGSAPLSGSMAPDPRSDGPAEIFWVQGAEPIAMAVPVRAAGHLFSLVALLPPAALRQAVDDVPRESGWAAMVLDGQGRVIAAAGQGGAAVGQPAPAGIAAAFARPGAAIVHATTPAGVNVLFGLARTPRFGVAVAIAAPVASFDVQSHVSLLLLVGLGSVLVALGLFGALVVSASISRPIEALAAAARRLGDSDSLPPIPGGLIEVDEVGQAMSAASATLIERQAALSDTNANLAAKVGERTAALADANRALDEQRTRLGLVLDHMPVGVLVSYPDGHVMYANREARRLLGFVDGQDDFLAEGRPALRRTGTLLSRQECPLWLSRHGVVTDRDMLSMERLDGTTVEVEVSAGPVLDSDGNVALAVATLQDISARLEAEDSRRRSQRLEAVGQLTGGVAHEFNNLLMAIGGCLDMLAPHVRDERARVLLENAARAADRGATLTRQLLAFARRQHLQAEPVDLNALVGSLAELLGTTLGRAIEVATDLAPDCWPAIADATQLELVLLNLAINARDAMPAGGRLTIGTGNAVRGEPRRAEEPPPGEYAVLRVTDTGTGMTPDVLARAFEPFFTTKQVGQGSGLGLPHVLGVAQQLGGGLAVESAPDRGTSIAVFLPRAAAMPPPPRRSALRPPRPRALHGMRLLLADDDAEVRAIARAMLEEMGALVIEADSASAALLLVRTEPGLDLILADYTMPYMTGLELAAQVAVLLPGVPVVLMTGYSATTLGDMGANVRAVLQKPFRAEAMARVLTEARGLHPLDP